MNYAGKFDAALTLDGQGSRSPAHAHVDSFTAKGHGHVPAGAFVVPDPNLLFHGHFDRVGVDLVLSRDGQEYVVHDYFKGEKRAAIASPDGAHLTSDIVDALTGHVQMAQAAPGAAAAAAVIGHVTKLAGSATVVRNGVSIILNNGDNVEKGDAVATGSDSTLGITFIDGTVFGLSANARMVLNEMVYDPNGSSNSSLLSLVAGTITFVAGETAKRGDMKVDTPVATMGIRGTAVVTTISFIIPAATLTNPNPEPQPQADFQVLVEPDGHTGSYILYDKTTLLPIATVNQAGQMIQISGGNVTVTNALLSPEVQKLISEVFTLKFTDNSTNTKLTSNFTDTITPDNNGYLIKTASGITAQVTTPVANTNVTTDSERHDKPSPGTPRAPNQPVAVTTDLSGHPTTKFAITERAGQTNDTADSDVTGGTIIFTDLNPGDLPTAKMSLAAVPNFTYQNANHQDVTATLTTLQKQDIAATQIDISVVPNAANANNGSAVWTYSIPDHAFDFLAEGETLTLTYNVRVDDNFALNNEFVVIPITITITGTNDVPVITSSVPTITFAGGTSVPGGPLTSTVPTSGTLTFTDVDLTDTHTVKVALTDASLPGGVVPPGPLAAFEKAMSVAIASNADSTGTGDGTISWSLADLPVFLADFIPKDETLTLTYTVTLTDSQGATATQTITVTIQGTDEAAVVWIATAAAGSPPGGFWKDAANWETGTVPTLNDDVIIITDQLHGLTPSYPVTIDEAAFANSVTMNDFGGPPPELDNKSSLTIAGKLMLSADSILSNFKAGTITVGGPVKIEGTASVTNAGLLTLSAGGDITTATSLVNTGTIDLTAGTLNLGADIANSGGTVQVDFGAMLDVRAATIDGGELSISGTLVLEDASVLKNGVLVIGDNEFVVRESSDFTLVVVPAPGLFVAGQGNSLDNESITNTGHIEVLANGELTLDRGTAVANSSGAISLDSGATLVLDGATISGGSIYGGSTGPFGAIDVTGDSKIDGSAELNLVSVTVENAKTLTLDDATLSGATVTDKGTVKVDAGKKLTLKGASLTGGKLNIAGTLDSSGTTTVTNTDITNNFLIEAIGGVLTLAGTSAVSIANDGTIRANGGELDINGEPVTNNDTLASINDGTLELISTKVSNASSAGVSVDATSILDLIGATIQGGTVTLAGTLESAGISAIDEAGIVNTGTINVTSGTLTIDPAVQRTITNHSLIEANGGVLDIIGDLIVNTGTIEAIHGGSLKLNHVTVTNSGGSLVVDGTSSLYLSSVAINGGTVGNAGHLYSVADFNKFTAAVTNTGTIETMGGTLDLAGGVTGTGSLIIDSGAKLELAGADAQTVTFAGGVDTLQLDDVAGHSFAGTIAGQASTGGKFNVTGTGNITSASGDALDFTASGGTAGAPADIVLTPAGTLIGAANGLVVTQNGVGDILLEATAGITGLAGNGIVITQNADGATGSTHITNTSSIVGASGHAAIFIQENTIGTARIDDFGTIGPDDAGTVTSTTSAIVETGGHLTINNTGEINGNISVATATFNNELGGTWTVSGSSVFGSLSSIVNAGEIALHNGASISGIGLGIINSGGIDSWGTASINGNITNSHTIAVDSGTLTLFGSLSGVGSVTIHADATLWITGTVAQTIAFSGIDGELKIDPLSLGGSISGFAATDKIDLSGIEFDSNTGMTFVNNSGHTGGVLTVTDDDGHSISLTLVGDYSNATFAIGNDGSGHALITTNATGQASHTVPGTPPSIDTFFASASSDILLGSAGQDQFVFSPAPGVVQHTILNFDVALDRIDVRQFNNVNTLNDLAITQQHADTLIALDNHESILLKNVLAANLHASDFIVTNHGGTI